MLSDRSSKTKVRFVLPVTIRKRFSFLQIIEGITFGLVRMYVMPYHISWIIFILDLVIREIVAIPMGKSCAPLVADLLLFGYQRDFITSFSDDNQADMNEAFNSTSRYLDDLLNIDSPYFEGMGST